MINCTYKPGSDGYCVYCDKEAYFHVEHPSPAEAPDLSSEHNASRKLAQIPPKDESVKSANTVLNTFWYQALWSNDDKDIRLQDEKSKALAALESAVNEIIGEDEACRSLCEDIAICHHIYQNRLLVEQRNRLRSWIDGK